MGMIKPNTRHIPIQPPQYRLKGVHPDWEMHPSYIAGIEAIDAYNMWVCEVVMPIAFQWIEEHKADVYATVAPEHKDDVGVVIAAAFELVKQTDNYKAGLAKSAEYQASLADGTWDPTTINPVWTEIVDNVRAATEAAFVENSDVLGDTIR